MSDRCNKCKHFLPDDKFCRKHHRTAHSRDHVCREFKSLTAPADKQPEQLPVQADSNVQET